MATARRFALAMGLTAFAVVCVIGIWRQSALESTLLKALVALVLFAVMGYVCGMVGAAIMKEAVKTELKRAKDAREAAGLPGRPRTVREAEDRNVTGKADASEEPAGSRS